jgi:cobalt-zinc-cadmium resistance protein CzcA
MDAILRFVLARRLWMLLLVPTLLSAGIWSYQRLPIDAVPDITNIQVQINTEAPGYSPLEAEQRITYPVENALLGFPRLSHTRSLSRYGLSQVTAVFEDGTDIYFARNLISERLGTIKGALPEGLEPVMGPVSTGLGEVYSYTVSAEPGALQPDGQPYDIIALREIQDWIIKPQLARVPGVVEINSIGGFAKQYHVLPDPAKLLQFRVGLPDLLRALRNNNSNRSAGYVESNGQQLLVRSPGQLQTPSDIQDVVVALHQGAPVRVRDLAEVAIGRELRTGAATLNGEETVLGTAMMRMGENSRSVARALAAKLEQIRPSLPAGVILQPVYDRTSLVDKTIATVGKNLLEGALLVIVVLFLLLGNVRAALITAAVIPLSMMATLSGMLQAGVSANLMSLGALDFGLIVDGAVIIVENTTRRLAEAQKNGPLDREARLRLVFDATREVIRPSLFGVLIITLVYVPLFSLSGVEGRMFHPMAATVVMALLAALVLSVTLVPAAVALFMTRPVAERENRVMGHIKALYRLLLLAAMKKPWVVLGGAGALVAASLWLATHLGREFIPQLDEGDMALHALRITGTGLEQSVAMQKVLEQHLLAFPEVALVFARIGTQEVATDPMPPNVSDTFVIFKPRSQWPDPHMPKSDLLARMESALTPLPGNQYEFTQPIQMRFNELISGVRADLGIKVFGDDLEVLLDRAQTIRDLVSRMDGATDVHIEQVEDLPVLSVVPKRTALARYGLDLEDLQDYVATAIGGTPAGAIFEGDRRFDLVVRLPEAVRTQLHRLHELPVALADGGYVPLGEVAELQMTETPSQISRENGKRRVVVTVNVRGRDLGSFVNEARSSLEQNLTLPPGYWLDYGGTFEQMESATRSLSLMVPLTLALILLLLLAALGSLRDAVIIFTGIPLALCGGIVALWLRHMPLSISAGVGFIALSGIAVLNGLVLLAFIRERWRTSDDLNAAIVEGALIRLRPVLMTALVASLGFVPMAFNTGTGAEVQRPLATVVIGGLLSSTLLTLLVLPALYRMIHRKPLIQP